MDAATDPAIPDVHRNNPHSGALFTKTLHHDTYATINPTTFDLTGKTVLITGASRGIGRTLAVSFTKARVSGLCLVARGDLSVTIAEVQHAAKEAGIPGPTILGAQLDVTSQSSIERCAGDFKRAFPKGLDILINNAGYLEPEMLIHESDPGEWWQSFEVSVKGPYLLSRSFIPLLLDKNDGLKTIVNITSIGAHMLFPGMSGYNTAKLALCRFTEYIDTEYSENGVIAFTVHPGGVKTDMGMKLPVEKQAVLTDTAELCADSVVWLAAKRREYLGGTYVSAQWDMPQLEKRGIEVREKKLLRVRLIV
jgi:NAD(P)-dependent dehydrogenase (short-subunit alcohol dehydrogenase family)